MKVRRHRFTMELRVADNRIGKRIGAEKRMTDAI